MSQRMLCQVNFKRLMRLFESCAEYISLFVIAYLIILTLVALLFIFIGT